MITRVQVQTYEQVRSQLEALYEEIATLAKKAPDAPLNRFKVQIVNERIRVANTLLVEMHRPFKDFTEFQEVELPSASDAVIVVSQYIDALEGWRSANVVEFAHFWYWDIGDRSLHTTPPSRFRREGDE